MDVVRVAAGNFLEMYDFMVFGYYAAAIGRAFFPTGNPFATLMLSLMTFGAGFLMRPIGAVVLGAYTDRHGRRKGLILSLSLMSVGILTLALTPGYRTIGLVAPILVVLGRLVQGFSAGVELGNVSVYLAEIAPEGRKGFYVSWQSASQQVAVVTAAGIGALLALWLTPRQMGDFGWRVPLLVGCAIAPFIFLLRRSLKETDAFRAMRAPPSMGKVWRELAGHWRPVLIACTLAALLTAYPAMAWLASGPSFGRMLAVELWLSFVYASYNGAMVVYLTELIPAEVRASGFSLAYSLATAIFGGFTPAIATGLIQLTGNHAIPGAWLSAAAALGLGAALVARPAVRRRPR